MSLERIRTTIPYLSTWKHTKRLCIALKQDPIDEKMALDALEKGANPRQKHTLLRNAFPEPLAIAAYEGSVPVVKKLIEKRADVNALDEKKGSALFWACDTSTDNDRAIIQCLLDNKADINPEGLLRYVIDNAGLNLRRLEIFECLLGHGIRFGNQVHTAEIGGSESAVRIRLLLLDAPTQLTASEFVLKEKLPLKSKKELISYKYFSFPVMEAGDRQRFAQVIIDRKKALVQSLTLDDVFLLRDLDHPGPLQAVSDQLRITFNDSTQHVLEYCDDMDLVPQPVAQS